MHAETLLCIVRRMTNNAVEDRSAQIRPISAGQPPGFGIGVEGSAGSVQNGCGRATFNPRPPARPPHPPGAINQPDRRILPLLIRGRRWFIVPCGSACGFPIIFNRPSAGCTTFCWVVRRRSRSDTAPRAGGYAVATSVSPVAPLTGSAPGHAYRPQLLGLD